MPRRRADLGLTPGRGTTVTFTLDAGQAAAARRYLANRNGQTVGRPLTLADVAKALLCEEIGVWLRAEDERWAGVGGTQPERG